MSRAIRPIRIEGDIAYVPLTRGYEAIVDASDANLISGSAWHAHVSRWGEDAGFKVYARATIGGVGKFLHRLLLNAPGGAEIDHIDGDGLNNRRCNLRQATTAQNQHNQKRRADNKSGFKGVFFAASRGKWQASIRANGKQVYIGSFKCRTAAWVAYVAAAKRLRGEFARAS